MTDTWPERSASQSTAGPSTPTRASRNNGLSNLARYDHFIRTSSSGQSKRFSVGETVIIGQGAVMRQKWLQVPDHQVELARTMAKAKGKGKTQSSASPRKQPHDKPTWFSEDGLQPHDKVGIIVDLYSDERERMMAKVRWFARPSAVWGADGPAEDETVDDYELYYTSDSAHLHENRARQSWHPHGSPGIPLASSKLVEKTPLCLDQIPIAAISHHVQILTPQDPSPTRPLPPSATPCFVVKKVYDAKPIQGAEFLGGIDWAEVHKQGLRDRNWDVEATMAEGETDEEVEEEESPKKRGRKADKAGSKRTKRARVEQDDESEDEASSDDDAHEVDDYEGASDDEQESDDADDQDSDKENVEDEDEDSEVETLMVAPIHRRKKQSKVVNKPKQGKRIVPKLSQRTRDRANKVAIKKMKFSGKQKAKQMIKWVSHPLIAAIQHLLVMVPDCARSPLPPAFTLSPEFAKMPSFERAKAMLHVSATPELLPCREHQRNLISSLLGDAILGQTGTCLYVHGVPGTGKTATVHSIVRELREDKDMNAFQFVEINGMKIAEPTTAFSILWEAISGQKRSSKQALVSLENHFQTPDPGRKTTVVLVDELDQMITKKQDVIYNFFNWPHVPHSRLIVIAVANTMDLPEREMSGKIRSRLGSNRIVFTPYKWEELQTILLARLEGLDEVFAPRAIEIIARRVAAGPGDARRALDIARRTVEKVDQRNRDRGDGEEGRCEVADATATYTEMTNHGSSVFIKRASLHQKILLLALAQCIKRAGVPEVELEVVIKWHLDFLRQTCITPVPSQSEVFAVVAELHALRLLVTESQRGDYFQRVRTLVSNNDLFEVLKEDDKLKNHVPRFA
ncbi:BQ2448_7725 [Microbotryum intermedium]|uniref:Origin recognition complex subunit 1 n=1 Tax=Microbotryum intermedium TaxID=269621 RepID=A0A238FUF2_9BASI|nr:BQ2448_7725 [Microbotryum intermedium]